MALLSLRASDPPWLIIPPAVPQGRTNVWLTAVIENENWLAFNTRYGRAGTLFYLDPPHWGSEADHGSDMFMRADFQRMADKLASIDGRFIL